MLFVYRHCPLNTHTHTCSQVEDERGGGNGRERGTLPLLRLFACQHISASKPHEELGRELTEEGVSELELMRDKESVCM